ncbi:hypothetical protein PENTCL1PPCAC_15440 [Pristionchus entomophagus]|uniref:G protein-coupled receptor n=1 Tax=Pristionchus entomophagus TaxID=358040 RepID=A0AAV5TDJ4_9BILA|nr:hypothetical protein PENTCL1PPCAC_15440 [Pristionchus entomophagus]
MTDGVLFAFFNENPVIPVTVIIVNVLAFIPIICLLYIANVAPLHSNCRYILCIWSMGFGVVFVVTCALAKLDLENATGYMPLDMYEPHIRFELYQWHVMCTTFCSSFEIALSLERMLAIVHPRHYHFSGMAWKTLAILTLFLVCLQKYKLQ